jgi:hypothetical protein
MSIYGQLIRARHDELLQEAARRLAAQARRRRHRRPHDPIAAPARRPVTKSLRRLFS